MSDDDADVHAAREVQAAEPAAEPGLAATQTPEQPADKEKEGVPEAGANAEGEKSERPGDVRDQERLDSYGDTQAVRQEGQTIINDGASFTGPSVLGDGPVVFFEQSITMGGRQAKIMDGRLRGERVRRYQRTYVKVARFDEMRAQLDASHVVVVSDAPNRGRRMTSLVLLAERVGADSVHTIIADSAVSLEAIYESPKLFTDNNGYLLDLRDQPVRIDIVEALSGRLAARPVYLVIIHDPAGDRDDEPGPYTFEHPGPQPLDVLRSHLDVLLDDHMPRCGTCTTELMAGYVDRCVADENFAQQLKFQPPPRVMAQFAELLAAGMHAGDEPEVLLGRLPNRLRDAVEKALREPDVQSDEPHHAPQRQAVLIAFAVFHRRPLTDVFETSRLLFEKILPQFETRQVALNQVVFDSSLKYLIDDSMRDTKLVQANDTPRRANFVAPALSGIVLDVAWHDFACTRDPIQAWLDVLAGNDRMAIQVRAAQVAGILATYDFDEIYRKLIGPWARSRASYRESAALALEMASYDDRLLPRIRERIRDWAASPSAWLQDSAARAYGTRIGATIPHDALDALHTFARKAELSESSAIAVALARLFAAAASDLVLNALGEWIVSDVEYVRRHAVRAVLLLARFSVSSARQSVPALPGMVADNTRRQDSLVTLWRGALISPETSKRAWESMRRWLLSADSDCELAVVEPLALRVFARPLAGRAEFYLGLWTIRSPGSAVLQRLYKAVMSGRR